MNYNRELLKPYIDNLEEWRNLDIKNSRGEIEVSAWELFKSHYSSRLVLYSDDSQENISRFIKITKENSYMFNLLREKQRQVAELLKLDNWGDSLKNTTTALNVGSERSNTNGKNKQGTINKARNIGSRQNSDLNDFNYVNNKMKLIDGLNDNLQTGLFSNSTISQLESSNVLTINNEQLQVSNNTASAILKILNLNLPDLRTKFLDKFSSLFSHQIEFNPIQEIKDVNEEFIKRVLDPLITIYASKFNYEPFVVSGANKYAFQAVNESLQRYYQGLQFKIAQEIVKLEPKLKEELLKRIESNKPVITNKIDYLVSCYDYRKKVIELLPDVIKKELDKFQAPLDELKTRVDNFKGNLDEKQIKEIIDKYTLSNEWQDKFALSWDSSGELLTKLDLRYNLEENQDDSNYDIFVPYTTKIDNLENEVENLNKKYYTKDEINSEFNRYNTGLINQIKNLNLPTRNEYETLKQEVNLKNNSQVNLDQIKNDIQLLKDRPNTANDLARLQSQITNNNQALNRTYIHYLKPPKKISLLKGHTWGSGSGEGRWRHVYFNIDVSYLKALFAMAKDPQPGHPNILIPLSKALALGIKEDWDKRQSTRETKKWIIKAVPFIKDNESNNDLTGLLSFTIPNSNATLDQISSYIRDGIVKSDYQWKTSENPYYLQLEDEESSDNLVIGG